MEPYVGKEAEVVEFTGNDSKGCRMARLSINGNRLSFVFRVRDLEPIDGYVPSELLNGDSRIVVGSRVIIHRHRPVDGNANWASGMEPYVGKQADVVEFTGHDSKGCRMARLSINGNRLNFVFRVRDLELVDRSGGYVPSDSLSGDSRIAVGSSVRIHKHRAVDCNANWASGMEPYVGKIAEVVEFTGHDSKGCRMARLSMNGNRLGFVFRVRDLELVDEASHAQASHALSDSLSGDSRIRIGSSVRIHKHRAIDGNTNWASGMEPYVGKEGVISEFTGTDSKGCKMARLSVDGRRVNFVFRVRDLEFLSNSSPALSDSLAGDDRICVGSRVIIRKHRPVNGKSNWASAMDKYVDREAIIHSFLGTDAAGCRVAKVVVDGSVLEFSFRVRDMTFLA